MKKVLLLAANPKDTPSLRLDQEVRDIYEGLRRSQHREQFSLESRLAVEPQDFRRALLEVRPQIVHFSGHGSGEAGLALEDKIGKAQLAPTAAIAGLLGLFADTVECVVLNACYSEVQAEAISQHIRYVIGMNQAIGDRSAIEFAVSFYDALGAGESIEFAYKLGCNAIALVGAKDSDIPVLKCKLTQTVESDESIASPGNALSQSELSGMSFKPAGDRTKIFISYRSKDPDMSLAQEFYQALVAAGHEPFMAGESIHLGEDWSKRIDAELECCDYFLLLLSPKSAVSEMVTEEVRRAKQLKDSRPEQRPIILPIRVCFPMSSPLNYDLRGYLQRIQQREWQSPTDTPIIVQEILSLVSAEQAPLLMDSAPVTSIAPTTVNLSGCPLPVAEPELPRGQVGLDSAFYVQRDPLESRCYDTVLHRAALIRIKAPRQMGKTSLMARILHHAEQEDYRIVPLTFQLTDENVFADLNQFLRRFCALVSRRLQISPKQVDEFWDSDLFGPKDNCNAYFDECLLPSLNSPLVLALDEVDCLFPFERVAKEFFTLLRAWNEQSKTSKLWEKLRIVVVHSTEVYVVMDTNSSPFNVGLPIELIDFTAQQVQDLSVRHGLNWNTAQVERLMEMVGGHPYLVRLALYHIAKSDFALEQLLEEAPTDAGIYSDHLRQHLWNLKRHPELGLAMKQAITSNKPVRLDSTLAFKLHGMGLVDLCGNDVALRYNLYQQYLRDRLGV